MRLRPVFALVGASALLTGLLAMTPIAVAQAPNIVETPTIVEPNNLDERPSVAAGVIVKAATAGPNRRKSLARSVDEALPADVDVAGTNAGGDGMALVKFDTPVDVETATEVAREVAERPDVEWAVPNQLRQIAAASPVRPNDPYFSKQFNLWDPRPGHPKGGYSTKAPHAWKLTQGDGVVVAVVDTGIVPGHPDLKNQLVAGYDFVDDECVHDAEGQCHNQGTNHNAGDGNGLDPDPSDPGDWIDAHYRDVCGFPADYPDVASSWHGTHVAGIIAAETDNRIGTAGVAPRVKIQPVRALGHCGGYDWDIGLAIMWASGADLADATGDEYYAGVPANETPAQVINLSLSGLAPDAATRDYYCALYGSWGQTARANGSVLVAAAGNNSRASIANANLSIPAACPGFISVAATSRTGHRAFYSNAGSSVDIAAPGGDPVVGGSSDTIWSAFINAPKQPTNEWDFTSMFGTSMAAPAVSGAAALVMSLGVERPADVEKTLRSAVTKFPKTSKAWRNKRVTIGSQTFRTDLNCTVARCGAGVVDLSKLRPMVTGKTTVGSMLKLTGPLRQFPNSAVSHVWTISGSSAVVGRGTEVRVPRWALGKRITVTSTFTQAGNKKRSVTTDRIWKGKPRTFVKVPKKVSKSKRAKVRVRVGAGWSTTGKVRIYSGKKRIGTKTLRLKDRNTVTVKIAKLPRGKHRIRVVYSGNAQYRSSTSPIRTVTSH